MFGFGLCNISDTVVRAKNQWVQNKTLFKLLDLSYFVCLELHRAIVMDYTNTPVQLMMMEKALIIFFVFTYLRPILNINVVVNFLSQIIFIFLLFKLH